MDTNGQQNPVEAGSDFAILQEKILTPNCATSGCHDSRNAVGGLDLSPAVAYNNLVGVAATNENAKADKLLRVKAGDPYKSFLYVKLDSANLHKSDGYGSVMPLGSRALPAGQLQFITLWIAGGASKSGSTLDRALLNDPRPQNETIALAPPSNGVQFRVPSFGIPPQFEREIFYAQKNPQDLLVTKFELIQRDRSHHFILYAFDPKRTSSMPQVGVFRDLYNAKGEFSNQTLSSMSGRTFVIGSQLKQETIEFPEGMAMKIPSTWLLDLNSHYTNGTRETTQGEVLLNLHSTTPDKVKTLVKPLELGFYNLSLLPKRETVVETTFLVGGASQRGRDRFDAGDTVINLIGVTSHTHRMGRRFVVQIVGGARNGETIYTCTNWLNPPLVHFKTPIVLRRGEGLKSIATYFNDTDEPVSFGFRSTDEMNFIFGYYY
ncbi:MAG: hypothetical protein EAZ92_11385 [Candidatus Kapaibacterium sp.]|nr:MAG: hypothetical protein EAZ92_11385 [Candidatus Kapabacteria bacterium]